MPTETPDATLAFFVQSVRDLHDDLWSAADSDPDLPSHYLRLRRRLGEALAEFDATPTPGHDATEGER